MAVGGRRLTLLLLAAIAASPTNAQEPSATGFDLGVRIAGNWLVAGETYRTIGVGAHAGYRLNSVIELLGSVERASFSGQTGYGEAEWKIWSFAALARLHLASRGSDWIPYLQAGLAHRSGRVDGFVLPIPPPGTDGGADIDANGFAFGAGALIRLDPALALDVGGTVGLGYLPNPADDDPFESEWYTLGVGLSWWP